MADRFPEIDDLDTSPSAPHTKLATASDDLMDSSSDPSSDFLAREAAILGPDAAQFSASQGPTRNPQSAPKRNAAVVEHEEEDEGDLLGGADDDEPSGGQSMAQAMHSGEGERDGLGDDGFESRYPVEDTSNQGVGPGGSITGTDMPIRTNGNYREETEEEPEIIRQWRSKRDADIAHRAEISSKKKSSTLKQAQESVDEFYENYNNKKDKSIAQTRQEADEFLENRQDTTSGGTSWQRIARLVDLNASGSGGGKKGGKGGEGAGGGELGGGAGSGADKERFRSLLRELAKDEKAPGASGY